MFCGLLFINAIVSSTKWKHTFLMQSGSLLCLFEISVTYKCTWGSKRAHKIRRGISIINFSRESILFKKKSTITAYAKNYVYFSIFEIVCFRVAQKRTLQKKIQIEDSANLQASASTTNLNENTENTSEIHQACSPGNEAEAMALRLRRSE